jgi:hypothetical protein
MKSPVTPSLSQITMSRSRVVVNVVFNVVISIISDRTAKNKRMRESYFYLSGENCMKIITTGQIFLSNDEMSRFLK